MNRSIRRLLSILVAIALCGATSFGQRRGGGGGGVQSGGSARTSVNHNTNVNANRSANVNADRNVNVNASRNANVNVNRDVDVHGGYYQDGCCYHPVAAAAAVTATAVATASAIGSTVPALPPACASIVVNGLTYQQCGSTWYQPQFVGTETTYVVVAAPQ
jgi:hypothetical protein